MPRAINVWKQQRNHLLFFEFRLLLLLLRPNVVSPRLMLILFPIYFMSVYCMILSQIDKSYSIHICTLDSIRQRLHQSSCMHSRNHV